jgi:FkbM family methyltransferase
MLIPTQTIIQLLKEHNIQITGVLHLGAHDCEEAPFYANALNLPSESVVWIDAIEKKVEECRKKGIPNVYQVVISDTDDEEVTFNVANNFQSSSILEFGTHANHYASIKYIDKFLARTKTIDTFLSSIPGSTHLNFWNLDIQGVELKALQGAVKNIQNVSAIYTEISVEEVYKGGCRVEEIDTFLSSFGFLRVSTLLTGCGWGDALYLRKPSQ